MAKKEKHKLKIIPLGGVEGIGKNITVFEYDNDIIIVDCGLAFPDEEMFGVDLVLPDMTYLYENSSKIKGLVVTHGHEDHIGAIPYLLKRIQVPVYSTRLTLGILEGKLEEHGILKQSKLIETSPGQTIKLGQFTIEFIPVTHSIPDAVALNIETPAGRIIYTGDFKIDHTPVHGETIDLQRFAILGSKGVRLLMCDSTNVERPGYTPTEIRLYTSFERYFAIKDKRILVATFSSNIHRVQQIINTSAKYGRKVVLLGRSMVNIVNAAIRLGYMDIPEGTIVDIGDIKKLSPGQVTLITTGSQGEPMSALYRMAFGEHNQVAVGKNDLVILSSSPIPGNERMINSIINELLKKGVEVVNDAAAEVHVSGHACAEELKLIHALTRPECFVPLHGEYKHLKRHAELAKEMGLKSSNIIIPETGKVIELTRHSFAVNGEVPSGQVLVDGYGVGDVGSTVLRDRKRLAEDGVLIVYATVDFSTNTVITGPDINSKGFVYVKESEELLDELRRLSRKSLERCLSKNLRDFEAIKLRLREDLSSAIAQKTKRKPVIMPVIIEASI
jgi:ribonuclease J